MDTDQTFGNHEVLRIQKLHWPFLWDVHLSIITTTQNYMQNHHLRTRKIWFVSIPWTLLNHVYPLLYAFSSFLWVDTVDTSRFEADLGSTSQGYFAHGSLVVWHGVNFQVPSMWICQLSVVMSPGFIGFIVWTLLNNIGCSAQFAWCMLVSCPFLASLLGVISALSSDPVNGVTAAFLMAILKASTWRDFVDKSWGLFRSDDQITFSYPLVMSK